MRFFRKYFIAGLLVWVPLGVTVLIIKLLVDMLDKVLLLVPAEYQPEVLLGFKIPGFGVVVSVVVVFVTGMIVANLFGRQLIRLWEAMLSRIPLVKGIYSAVKQLLETLVSPSGKSFRKVLLVEYPRPGCWSLAFQTSEELGEVSQKKQPGPEVAVFIPTTPNPTSGFLLFLPRQDIVELDMSVDEGLKMLLSFGMVLPESTKQQLIDEHGAS